MGNNKFTVRWHFMKSSMSLENAVSLMMSLSRLLHLNPSLCEVEVQSLWMCGVHLSAS